MIQDRMRAVDGMLHHCSKCGGELDFRGRGKYICKACKFVEYDDFGKIRQFIENNEKTGNENIADYDVSLDKVAELLREGRIEIANGSKHFIHCVKCGADIRYGKYCEACSKELPKGSYTLNEVGEAPKAKMHTFDAEKSKMKRY